MGSARVQQYLYLSYFAWPEERALELEALIEPAASAVLGVGVGSVLGGEMGVLGCG